MPSSAILLAALRSVQVLQNEELRPVCVVRSAGKWHRTKQEAAMPQEPGKPQVTPFEPEHRGSRRDPEERPSDEHQVRDKMLDKTLADSFPTSDPPSSIPDPAEDSLHPEEDRPTPKRKRA
jgi:hypothetical protein